jgi:hypothetical protein
MNWAVVAVVGIFAIGLIAAESKWAWSGVDWFFVFGSALLGPFLALFFSVRFILDCTDWLREKPERFRENRRYHGVFFGIVLFAAISISQHWGSKLRVFGEGKGIERTLDSVAAKCRNSTAPEPRYRGQRVQSTNCEDGSFLAGFDSGFLESHAWGFVRGKPKTGDYNVVEHAFGDVWVWRLWRRS